jgi:hypothetical protein
MFSAEAYHLLILTSIRERREHRVYKQLLQSIPGLEERLMNGSDEDVLHVSELVCRLSFQQFDWSLKHIPDSKGSFQRQIR